MVSCFIGMVVLAHSCVSAYTLIGRAYLITNAACSWGVAGCSPKEGNASFSHLKLEAVKAKSFAGNRFDRSDCSCHTT